jgi:hypothetical protein
MPEKNRLLLVVVTKPVMARTDAIPITRSPLLEIDAGNETEALAVDAEDAEIIASATTPKSEPCVLPNESVADLRLVEVD